ncbi:hypothetical protein [Paraburkholderia xenovorans]
MTLTIEQARHLAAQCWCEPETSGIEMDARLAEAFARALLSASKPAASMDDEQLIALLRQAGFNVGSGAHPDVWANELATEGEYDALNLFHELLAASPQPVAQPVEQTRALTDEQIDDLQEAREILENMVRSVELDGNYSTEATCTFLRQALQCLPAARPASGETE